MKRSKLFKTLMGSCDCSLRVTSVIEGELTVLVETAHSAGLSSCFCNPGETSILRMWSDTALTGKTIGDLVEGYHPDDLRKSSIAIAALNAGLPKPLAVLPEMFGQSFLEEKTRNGHLVVVGHFPFLTEFRSRVGTLSIIQEEPHLGGSGVEQARELFPLADTIVITASAFVNGTMEDLLKLTGNAYVVLMGATTPMSKDLFQYGVNALCGVEITNPRQVAEGVKNGKSFKYMNGLKRLTWFNPATV